MKLSLPAIFPLPAFAARAETNLSSLLDRFSAVCPQRERFQDHAVFYSFYRDEARENPSVVVCQNLYNSLQQLQLQEPIRAVMQKVPTTWVKGSQEFLMTMAEEQYVALSNVACCAPWSASGLQKALQIMRLLVRQLQAVPNPSPSQQQLIKDLRFTHSALYTVAQELTFIRFLYKLLQGRGIVVPEEETCIQCYPELSAEEFVKILERGALMQKLYEALVGTLPAYWGAQGQKLREKHSFYINFDDYLLGQFTVKQSLLYGVCKATELEQYKTQDNNFQTFTNEVTAQLPHDHLKLIKTPANDFDGLSEYFYAQTLSYEPSLGDELFSQASVVLRLQLQTQGLSKTFVEQGVIYVRQQKTITKVMIQQTIKTTELALDTLYEGQPCAFFRGKYYEIQRGALYVADVQTKVVQNTNVAGLEPSPIYQFFEGKIFYAYADVLWSLDLLACKLVKETTIPSNVSRLYQHKKKFLAIVIGSELHILEGPAGKGKLKRSTDPIAEPAVVAGTLRTATGLVEGLSGCKATCSNGVAYVTDPVGMLSVVTTLELPEATQAAFSQKPDSKLSQLSCVADPRSLPPDNDLAGLQLALFASQAQALRLQLQLDAARSLITTLQQKPVQEAIEEAKEAQPMLEEANRVLKARLLETEEQRDRLQKALELLETNIDNRLHTDERLRELGFLQADNKQAKQDLAKAQQELEVATKNLGEKEKMVSALTKQFQEATTQIDQLRTSCEASKAALGAEIQRLTDDLQKTRTEIQVLKQQKMNLELEAASKPAPATAGGDVSLLQITNKSLTERHEQDILLLAEKTAALDDLKTRFLELEQQIADLKSQNYTKTPPATQDSYVQASSGSDELCDVRERLFKALEASATLTSQLAQTQTELQVLKSLNENKEQIIKDSAPQRQEQLEIMREREVEILSLQNQIEKLELQLKAKPLAPQQRELQGWSKGSQTDFVVETAIVQQALTQEEQVKIAQQFMRKQRKAFQCSAISYQAIFFERDVSKSSRQTQTQLTEEQKTVDPRTINTTALRTQNEKLLQYITALKSQNASLIETLAEERRKGDMITRALNEMTSLHEAALKLSR